MEEIKRVKPRLIFHYFQPSHLGVDQLMQLTKPKGATEPSQSTLLMHIPEIKVPLNFFLFKNNTIGLLHKEYAKNKKPSTFG